MPIPFVIFGFCANLFQFYFLCIEWMVSIQSLLSAVNCKARVFLAAAALYAFIHERQSYFQQELVIVFSCLYLWVVVAVVALIFFSCRCYIYCYWLLRGTCFGGWWLSHISHGDFFITHMIRFSSNNLFVIVLNCLFFWFDLIWFDLFCFVFFGFFICFGFPYRCFWSQQRTCFSCGNCLYKGQLVFSFL